ncbi:hypothetical protein [Piscinibacter defluvii]|uniref:hypothetical protein n=1 Tax=Piscinibacter defluvii TaxID=1796922 RepID=UPI000FDE2C09|nr:hypothetical protein [Piscinibacter defluvii]
MRTRRPRDPAPVEAGRPLMAPTAAPGQADAFRILLADLPDADARRLAVFLDVRSTRLRHAWQIVSEGPVDLYIHDGDHLPTIPGTVERPPLQVRVLDASTTRVDEPSALQRPLQYDSFVDLLVGAEQRLAPPAGEADTGRPALPPEPPAPSVAVPLDARRFRLRRWPGAGVLQSMRHGMRMASFLSARYLSVDELSHLSGIDRQDCSTFLGTLLDADLLRSEPPASADAPAPDPRRPSAPAASARPDRGLLTSLRNKLGIRATGR